MKFFYLALLGILVLPVALSAHEGHVHAIKGSVVTDERVIYEVSGEVPGTKTARLWSDAALTEARADCQSRKGVLNECASVCGLNGCFSACALACEFPTEIAKRRAKVQSEYQKAKADFNEAAPNGTGRSLSSKARDLKKELDGLAEPHARMIEASRAEIDIVRKALSELRTAPPTTASSMLVAGRIRALDAKLTSLVAGRFSKNCSTASLPSIARKNAATAPGNMLSVMCDTLTDDLLINAGAGSPTTRIYKNARLLVNNRWQTISLSGTSKESLWLHGSASAFVRVASSSPVTAVSIYACTQSGSSVSCGHSGKKWQALGILKD